MVRVRRLAAALLVGALAAVPLAGPVHAAEPRSVVESVSPTPEGLDVRIRAVDLPAGVELDPQSARVELDGRRVPVTAEFATVESGLAVRRTMLVLDTSGSMAGERLPAALQATRTYLDVVPPDVEIGLVTFAQSAAVSVPPTLDRAVLRQALDAVRAEGGTSLYDALLVAREALGEEGERRILVLSDGEDTESQATLDAVLGGLQGPDVPVDAVVLGDEPAAAAVLQQVADVTKGRVLLAADATEASAAFESAASAFGTRLLVRVPVPADLAGRVAALKVTADSSVGEVATAAMPVTLPARPQVPVAQEPGRSLLASPLVLLGGLVTLFGGLAVVLTLAVSTGDTGAVQARRTRSALDEYGTKPESAFPQKATPDSRLGDSAVMRTALELAGRVVESRGIEARLALRLDRAAVKFTPREWVVLQATVSLLVAVTAFLLLGGLWWALVGGLLGAAGAHLGLGFKAKRRATAFLSAMPDALQLVASGLSSGYSLPQALDAAVREGEDPVATEFGRALAEARLGVPLETALDGVAERMGSRDFSWVVMAVRIQREVGGNLSDVLETLCKTLRDRESLRRQVAALSAEGRLSAYILIALPIGLALWLALSRPEYFGVMFTNIWGLVALAGSAVALVIGAFWMKALVKVEM